MKQIAIYGKGGIGKSTVASNISAALNERGVKVMQVGCDPKRDSTRILAGGHLIPAVLEIYRDKIRHGQDAHAISLDDIVFKTPSGIYCVEAGGPEPGIGCAGRGVLTALQILKDLKAFETYEIEVAIYDVLGDVVCGGFAMPIREGFASEIYLVCSGGFMSIYAANNIARAVQRLARGATPGWQGLSVTVTAMTRWSGRWSLRLPSVWAARSWNSCLAVRSFRRASLKEELWSNTLLNQKRRRFLESSRSR